MKIFRAASAILLLLAIAAPCAVSADCPERAEYRRLRETTRELLFRGEVEELQEMATRLREQKLRFSDGGWKLDQFYRAMEVPHEASGGTNLQSWDTLFFALDHWQQSFPDSATAKIALAHAHLAKGWQARGEGYADSLTEANRAGFRRELSLAFNAIRAVDSSRDPASNAVVIRILHGLPLEERAKAAGLTFEMAARSSPDYFPTYYAYANFLLPRWYGSKKELFQMAKRAAEDLGEEAGAELYARIMIKLLKFPGPTFFQDNFKGSMEWDLAKRGFLHMESRYPDSCMNLNYFALLASIARDSGSAKSLFERIDDDWDKGVWREEKAFKKKRKWATRR